MTYSFCTLPKEEILPSDSKESSLNDTNMINDSSATNEISDVFCYYDEKIIQEYDFGTGETALYRDNEDGTLSLLFTNFTHENGNDVATIFTNTGVFYIIFDEKKSIDTITYIDGQKYNTIMKNNYSQAVVDSLIYRNVKYLVLDKQLCYVQNFDVMSSLESLKKSFVRYSMASKYIPANIIIDEILEIIHKYIATQQINKDLLLERFIELQNFQDLCYESISTISQFITNPQNIDYRNLCNALEKKSNNISNLIDLYLSDELKEVNHDCKKSTI